MFLFLLAGPLLLLLLPLLPLNWLLLVGLLLVFLVLLPLIDLLVLVVELLSLGPILLGVLVVVVDLHGLDGGLHGEALDALDVDVLLALLRSDTFLLAVRAPTAPARPHLSQVDLSRNLLRCVLRRLRLSAHVV